MGKSAVDWVVEKLEKRQEVEVSDRTPEDFLIIRSGSGDYSFICAVLSVDGVITLSDVKGLFAEENPPQFIVNVPTKTLWSGEAINYIHMQGAAFGSFGDICRAASIGDVSSFRDKNMGFFINAIGQHTHVSNVTYVYNTVFNAHLLDGSYSTIAVIEAYNMSAEDVRNARSKFGHFDLIVKASSHGSITNSAEAAANSMGAEALTFGGLMSRLGK